MAGRFYSRPGGRSYGTDVMGDRKKGFIKANSKIICREEEGDALLFNPENGGIKMLNTAGYEVWKLCDGSRTLEQIIQKMKDEYSNAPAEVIEEDTLKFINDMKDMALIEKV